MRTSSSSSIARRRCSSFDMSKWRSSTSVICVPILSVGFSDVIGSWKIIAISRPRTSSSRFSDSFVRSRPSNSIEPDTISAGGFGSRPMIDSAVTDLPQPDSPTMPSVSPLSTEKLTPSTARTAPSRVMKYVRRSSTSSRGMPFLGLAGARVEGVAHAVRDEVRAEDDRRDQDAGDDDDVRVRAVGGAPVLGHGAERGVWGADAQADERQERLAEDHARKLEEHGDDQHAQRVG